MQHYYLGDLDKAKYYNDRFMRGKIEKKDSAVRIIHSDTAKLSFSYSKNSQKMSFKRLKEVLDSFANIKNELLKSLKRKIIASTYGTGSLVEPLDFYRNGLL